MRVALSATDSKRLSEIMNQRTIRFKDRIWDYAPLLLIMVLALQACQSGLGLYYLWQGEGRDSAFKGEVRNSLQKLIDRPISVATTAEKPSPPLNTQSGSMAMRGAHPVMFSGLLAQNPKAILGIDVSHYQGKINWQRVKATGVKFVYIKATEGASDVDPDFQRNWKEAGDVGIARGAYHVYSVAADVKKQIGNFENALSLSGESGELAPALDLEVALMSGEDVNAARKDVSTWLQEVKKYSKKRPLIYGSVSLFDGFFSEKIPANCSVWLAEYSAGPNLSARNWPKWKIWQYSDKAVIDGVVGYVDVHRFRSKIESYIDSVAKDGVIFLGDVCGLLCVGCGLFEILSRLLRRCIHAPGC